MRSKIRICWVGSNGCGRLVRTNIYIGLCASLDPGSVILSCEALTFVGGDLSESPIRTQVGASRDGLECGMLPLGEVVLGANYDAWYRAHAAEVDNLVVYDLDHVEGFPRRDGVDKDEAVDSDGMFGIQYRVLILVTRGVSVLCAPKGGRGGGVGGYLGLT